MNEEEKESPCKPSTQIPGELKLCFEALKGLDEVIAFLESKVVPVSIERKKETEKEDSVPEPSLCPLASEIRDIKYSIRGKTRAIRSITKSIEL